MVVVCHVQRLRAGIAIIIIASATTSACRARQSKAVAEQASVASFTAGDRVSCFWQRGSTAYPGKVRSARGSEVEIDYEDGDHEVIDGSYCQVTGRVPAARASQHTEPGTPVVGRKPGVFEAGDLVSCSVAGQSSDLVGQALFARIQFGYLWGMSPTVDPDPNDGFEIEDGDGWLMNLGFGYAFDFD